MKIKVFIAAILAICSVQTMASDWVYYERPVWYTDAWPDRIDCHVSNRGATRACIMNGVEDHTPVVLANADGSGVEVVNAGTHHMVRCKYRVCVDDQNYPTGNIVTPAGWFEEAYYQFVIPRGYYVGMEGDEYYAFKHGTGPEGARYPERRIINDQGSKVAKKPSQKVFDIWCDPGSDRCAFENKSIARGDLRNYIPQVETEWCDLEFCYSNSNYSEVVGLNPEGMYGS